MTSGFHRLPILAMVFEAAAARLSAAVMRSERIRGPQSPPRTRAERYEPGKATRAGKGVRMSCAQQRRASAKARNVRRNRAMHRGRAKR